MNKIHVTIHNDYRHLEDFMHEIPAIFSSEGHMIHKGRNEVRIISHGGLDMAVKRFARNRLPKTLIYTLKGSKAHRAYDNACRLKAIHLPTPAPVALVEVTNTTGLVTDSYYICEYTDMAAINSGLNEDNDYNRDMTTALAHFVARMHTTGVLHHDLNTTNVLYRKENDTYAFTLIDINRMTVAADPGKLDLEDCLLNITRFSRCSEMFCFFVKEYLRVRGLPDTVYDRAIAIKCRHDKAYARRKKIGGLLKQIFKRHRATSPAGI